MQGERPGENRTRRRTSLSNLISCIKIFGTFCGSTRSSRDTSRVQPVPGVRGDFFRWEAEERDRGRRSCGEALEAFSTRAVLSPAQRLPRAGGRVTPPRPHLRRAARAPAPAPPSRARRAPARWRRVRGPGRGSLRTASGARGAWRRARAGAGRWQWAQALLRGRRAGACAASRRRAAAAAAAAARAQAAERARARARRRAGRGGR